MKKINLLLLTIISLSLLATGCKSTSNLTDLQKATTNIEDDTNSYPEHWLTATENGYYMFSDYGYLTFFEPSTKEMVLLCNSPDCEHKISEDGNIVTDRECTAYYSNSYCTDKIWSYGTDILTLQKIRETGLWLTQVSYDGKERKPLVCISDNTEDIVTLILHKGYAYYSKSNSEIAQESELYKVELKKDATPQKIDSISETATNISHLKVAGDELYYVKSNIAVRDNDNPLDSELDYKLYKYNIESGEISKISDENIDNYAIDNENNILYYHVCKGDLYKMNMEDYTTKDIGQDVDLFLCKMTYNDEHLYLDNLQSMALGLDSGRKVYVLDTDGNLVKTIKLEGELFAGVLEYSEGDYIFCKDLMNWYIIDKNDLYSSKGDEYYKVTKLNISGLKVD